MLIVSYETLDHKDRKMKLFFYSLKKEENIFSFSFVLNNTFTLCTIERKTSLFASFIHLRKEKMLNSTTNFPTTTLKCLLENTELADILFNSFPLTEDEQNCTIYLFIYFLKINLNLF
jgi:hypothetical protein